MNSYDCESVIPLLENYDNLNMYRNTCKTSIAQKLSADRTSFINRNIRSKMTLNL